MIRKICNHCGRLYVGQCECVKRRRRQQPSRHDSWYDGKRWKSLSRSIRVRDYNTDRLALYFVFKGGEWSGHIKTLSDYLTTPDGQKRPISDRVCVHHIEPKSEAPEKAYDPSNLITLYKTTHELVHQIYNTGEKHELQELLRKVVECSL